MAEPTPIGTAKTAVNVITHTVPASAAKIPAFSAAGGEAGQKVPRDPCEPIAEDIDEQGAEYGEPEQGSPEARPVQEEIEQLIPKPAVHAYASRNRSRSQLLARFSKKVLTNSSMPTAKTVR